MAVDAVVGWFTRGQLPHDHAKRENIRLLRVLEAFDNFGCHPLVGSNLAGHDLGLDPGPAEVGQFCGESMVKQDVQTLQVTMQDGLLRRMEIVYAFGDVECELLAVVPRHLDLHVMQETPQGSTGAILKHDAQVGLSSASSKEEHNVWMADDLHDRTLILELLKFVLLDNLALDLLNGDDGVLPATAVHDTVATLRQLTVVAEISEGNLIILNKVSSLVRDVGASTSILLMLDHSLLQLALQVLWVRSRYLQLLEDLPLIR